MATSASSDRPSAADTTTAAHGTVPLPAAVCLPSDAGGESEELVFHEDHFALDPVELCKLRFLSGNLCVVDDLIAELEGSWQVILCPGEVLHAEEPSPVEEEGLQNQENNENTEEKFDMLEDAEGEHVYVNAAVFQLPPHHHQPPQDGDCPPSTKEEPVKQPHPAAFEHSSLTTACTHTSTKTLVKTDSTQSPRATSYKDGATGVPVHKDEFFKYVKFMHANKNQLFQTEYTALKQTGAIHAKIVAQAYQHKNRYRDILTYDHSRVVLSMPDDKGCDYINASYIDGYKRQNTYIATQGPVPTSVSDFWQMIWDHRATVIVMLAKVVEGKSRKCEQYWEEELRKPFRAGRGFTVVTTKSYGIGKYNVRHFKLSSVTQADSPLYVKHFQYTGWPDHGVPLQPASLVKFIQQIRKEFKGNDAPVVVHCSAGVGRTGTFITLDAMMERLKERDDLNIFEFVNEMRTRRMCMVQTLDQYMFIHDALSNYLTCGDTSVFAHELHTTIHTLQKVDEKGRSGFQKQFEKVVFVSRSPDVEDVAFAEDSSVAQRNRHKDMCPYANGSMYSGTAYLNATQMNGYSSKRAFVAAQAPMESTKMDVWEMIWHCGASMVVLLCQLEENEKESCCQFWPIESEREATFGTIEVEYKKTLLQEHWVAINLKVKRFNRTRKLNLFHFKSWPKHGRPPLPSVILMLEVMERMSSGQGISRDRHGPIVVMCDDGMSRSGVFITCMSEIERVKVEGGVDIFQTVKAARAQRPHMVYTTEQYKLCFEILQSYLDSFDNYVNFKAI